MLTKVVPALYVPPYDVNPESNGYGVIPLLYETVNGFGETIFFNLITRLILHKYNHIKFKQKTPSFEGVLKLKFSVLITSNLTS